MPYGRQLADRVLDAVNAHDLDRLAACYDRHAVLVTPLSMCEGRDRIIGYWKDLFGGFVDLAMTVWNRVEYAEPGFNEWMMTGTHTGTIALPDVVADASGRRITLRGCGVFHTKNGLVATHRHYFDLLELYCQLGFSLDID
ncbi:nuclear transport factor 2 family protein [Microbispora sp. SCL1-1]|uniref:nuclear transport factor 2 family protein n=1 Tax=unclassified Microbispora TaxID=2614687 RepID=UPI001159DC19|nr:MULTISPECIES: nuclear transport factor 2 family protein [unclassified Microbispora]NJP27810.1 nuclear transport factor 2 family protein [Microbispora sp. CL1-1]TQS10577.1 nuclear transport factor 2 family protein [Microbispora sp. SCL1-1]